MKIEIEELKTLNLESDDVLMVAVPIEVPRNEREKMAFAFRKVFPNNTVFIHHQDMKLTKIKQEELLPFEENVWRNIVVDDLRDNRNMIRQNRYVLCIVSFLISVAVLLFTIICN